MSRRVAASAPQASTQTTALGLTKALQGVSKAQDGFSKSVSALETLLNETFNDLETRLQAKQRELDELQLRYEQEEKNRKIEVDQRVREHGYDAAKLILLDRKEVAVREADWRQLQDDYAQLRANKEKELRDAIAKEQERSKVQSDAWAETLRLQKQAEVAKVEAQLETQVQHIEVLKATIQALKVDLDEQRKLTKDVAQAASKNMQMWVPPQHNSH